MHATSTADGGSRATAKETVMEMLQRLPDDVTLEDIEYHISVIAGFQRGVCDDDGGRCVSQEEAERRLLEPRTE
jgi:hypothetical protein